MRSLRNGESAVKEKRNDDKQKQNQKLVCSLRIRRRTLPATGKKEKESKAYTRRCEKEVPEEVREVALVISSATNSPSGGKPSPIMGFHS